MQNTEIDLSGTKDVFFVNVGTYDTSQNEFAVRGASAVFHKEYTQNASNLGANGLVLNCSYQKSTNKLKVTYVSNSVPSTTAGIVILG